MWKLDCEKDSKDIVERNKNHIYFYSNVTRESILKLNKYIREINIDLTRLQEEYNSNFSIYLHINSFGGVVFHALSCLEYIKNSKYPIITIIEGPCASAGTLISLMGSERHITESSFMLIHQLSSGFWGKLSEIEDEYQNLQTIMNIIKKIYVKRANFPKSGKYSLEKLLKHDLWIPSDKCLKFGLVDKIIE